MSFSLSQSKHTRIRVELPGRRHLNAADSRDESLYPRLHIPSAAISAKRDRNLAVKGQHEPGRRGTCGRARLKCANKFHWEAVLGVCGAVRDYKSIKLLWCLPTRRAGASADKEAAIKGASLIPLIGGEHVVRGRKRKHDGRRTERRCTRLSMRTSRRWRICWAVLPCPAGCKVAELERAAQLARRAVPKAD